MRTSKILFAKIREYGILSDLTLLAYVHTERDYFITPSIHKDYNLEIPFSVDKIFSFLFESHFSLLPFFFCLGSPSPFVTQ